MIKIITKKKYNEMVVRLKQLELFQEVETEKPLRAFVALDEEKSEAKNTKSYIWTNYKNALN